MEESFALTNEQWEALYNRHADLVYRVCFLYVKNKYDAEDLVQNTFLRLFKKPMLFQSVEHEKAWLIKTASNLCKDFFRHWWQKTVGIDEILEPVAEERGEPDMLLEKVLALPRFHRISIYLYYYEGYKTTEISQMLGKKEATIRSYLHRGRQELKLELEKDVD